MTGPALFELYSTSLTAPKSKTSDSQQGSQSSLPRDDNDGSSSATGSSIQAQQHQSSFFDRQKDQLLTKERSLPIFRESSLKAAASSLFGTRKTSSSGLPSPSSADLKLLSPGDSTSLSSSLTCIPRPSQSFHLKYLGNSVLDRRYTSPMIPWIIADIKRSSQRKTKDVILEVSDVSIRVITSTNKGQGDPKILFVHQISSINKFSRSVTDSRIFSYMTRDHADSPATLHVFQSSEDDVVVSNNLIYDYACP